MASVCGKLYPQVLASFSLDLSNAPGLVDPNCKRGTRQILVQFTSDETKNVIQRSKQEKTTVHGALSAAALLALLSLSQDQNNSSQTIMRSAHLISLWQHLAEYIPQGALTGCHIGIAVTTTVANRENSWQMARDIKAELQHYIPMSMPQTMLSIKYSNFLQRWFSGGPPLPPSYPQLNRLPTISISNNGRLSDLKESYGNGTVVNACYATSARHNTPGGLAVLNVQTIHGRLCLSLGYYSHVWTDTTARTYLEKFSQTLRDMTTRY